MIDLHKSLKNININLESNKNKWLNLANQHSYTKRFELQKLVALRLTSKKIKI